MKLFKTSKRFLPILFAITVCILVFNKASSSSLPDSAHNGTCRLNARNNVTTVDLADGELYEKWRLYGQVNRATILDGEIRLISAFVYEDYVAVVISVFGNINSSHPVICHYYDCNHDWIGSFESKVHPLAAVRCLRKTGADYMSIGLVDEPEGRREPIPLIDRTWKEPIHEVGVCIGQIYGPEPKWMDIVETVEHHRLIGATFFYVTVFEADLNTTHVIHDYSRLGLLDATWIDLEFRQITFQFHYIQQADCYYRSRMHSKWVINLDIDERFLTTGDTSLKGFLRSLPSKVVGLSFQVARVQVPDSSGITDRNSTYFDKNQLMSRLFWLNLKSIYQPQYSHIPYYHYFARTDPGKQVLCVNSTVGYFRHYRFTAANRLSGSDWLDQYAPFKESPLPGEFAGELRKRISKRLSYVLDKEYIKCDSLFLKGYKPGEFKRNGYICV